MAKRVAVVLSGCGVFDGSEIYETTLTLLRLDQRGVEVQCFAPDIPQLHVVNHLTGEVEKGEKRNVLIEAARLARGKIKDLAEADIEDFDAVILPGGFGAAKNLSDFALRGADLQVNGDLLSLVRAAKQAGKPVGLMCIAPAMSAKLFGPGVKCTIGTDAETAQALIASGCQHQDCQVDEICIDWEHKLVTTPAYMLANSISEAASGINKLVDEVLALS